jgi:predicted AlkP superfamily phosphohydrolase/phosphomutase
VPSPTKVLYLALDACDRDVVRELVDAGEMPTFEGLLHDSAVTAVEPPPGVYISGNWPSFTTSLWPDRHEYLCWVEIDPATYEWHETSPPQAKGHPFWHAVGDHGHRVAVFDVPHSVVAPESSVVQICEWGCHDRHVAIASSPPELVDELNEVIGPHPVAGVPQDRPLNFAPCDFVHRSGHHRTHQENAALWRDLLIGVDRKERASLRLLEQGLLDQGEWSLFMSVFGEAHCVGHQFWSLHDLDHPRHDPTMAALLGDPVREMYRRLDAVLASHLERVEEGTAVYVHLNHGMGPHYYGTHLLDEILHRLHDADLRQHSRPGRVAGAALGALPSRWQRRVLGGAAPALRRYVDVRPPGPNEPWTLPTAERRWFEVPNNAPGAIRINLRGREANGMVAPGAEYDRVCDDLTSWLGEIVNLDSGEPLVHRVWRADSRYERRPDDRFADLYVEWNSNHPIERVYSPRVGVVVGEDDHWRTGDHRRHGLLLARGPGIEPGVRADPIRTVDVSATLCAAVGVSLHDVDGVAAPDLTPAPFGADRPGQRGGRLRSPAPAHTLDPLTSRLAAEHRATRDLADHLDVREQQLGHRVNVVAAEVDAHARRLADLEREVSVRTVTDWVQAADVAESLVVSIVLPTRDRSAFLPRAIESVLAQTYRRIELIVVDDGSVDETPAVLAKYDDTRLRVVRTDGVGVGAARNRALDVATGDAIVYVDDDNVMMPWWCKGVVWGFTQRPDANVLYGARVIDDVIRARNEGQGAMPSVQFEPFDHGRLTEHNFADMNVLAHRSGLAEARFDERLSSYGDWDLFWRLTLDAPPLELPVLACHYTTGSPGRLSDVAGDRRDRDEVRAKFHQILSSG